MNKIVFMLFFVFSGSVFANDFFEKGLDLHLKFGGWSKHQSSSKLGSHDFNESHHGLGIQVWKGIEGSDWHLGGEYFTMRDSLNFKAHMFSMAGKYQWDLDGEYLTSIDVQTGLTYHNRGVLHTLSYKDEEGEYVVTDKYLQREDILTPMLMLTLRWFDKLETDIMYIPECSYNYYAVTFFRLGLKF